MVPLDIDAARRASDGAPDWVAERRTAGWEHFEKLGMPSEKEESWRYVELDFDLADYELPEQPGAPFTGDDRLLDSLGDLAGRAMVVDGSTIEVESDDRAVFAPIATAVAEHEDLIRGAYGQGIPVDQDVFAAAGHAFSTDGVFLYVPGGTALERPYYVDVQAATAGAVTMPRFTIVVEESSEAYVVLHYRSPMNLDALVLPQIEASIRDNSRLRLTVVQHWGYETTSISHARGVAGRDANLTMAEIGLGGSLSRLALTVDLQGRGSNTEILGAYFGEEDQTLDYRYTMHHAGTNTNSEMFLKGAVEDEALSVFTGMIRIDESAQKTDAFQTNRNLILSEGAAAQSVPNLEILANDVRCGHGSTVGPLDEEQRYYLMSRGLDRPRADRLQVRGFFEEALSRLRPELAGPVREWINAKYVTAQEEGRV